MATQLSSTTRMIISQVEQGKINPEEMLGGFIKLSGADVNFEQMLNDLGATINSKSGAICTLIMPAKNIGKISSPAISYVEFSIPNSVGLKTDSNSAPKNGNANKSSNNKTKNIIISVLAIAAIFGLLKVTKVI